MNRKRFLKQSLFAAGATIIAPATLQATQQSPIFSEEEITEFVFAAHSELEKTRKIVDKKPLILNCANQYTKGDFETALGGASHMGRKDIADMLVERGARMDIFNLSFLGHADIVKSLINHYPHLLMTSGPHGFTLLHHAKVGKHTEFAKWLEINGLEEDRFLDVFE